MREWMDESVPGMRIRGQLTCLRVRQKDKIKCFRLYVHMCLHVVSHIHDVYFYKSVKTLKQFLGGGGGGLSV